MQQKIVITGGPGTGKTTVINALTNLKFTCVPEVSREITLEARTKGIEQLFLTDPLLFSRLLLKKRKQQYSNANKHSENIIFFDRGIPDIFAYLNFAKQLHDFDTQLINRESPYTKVFITPPWKEIYTTDNERFESFEEAKKIHEFIFNTYKELNYEPIIIPTGTIDDRVKFIKSHIE